MADPAEIARGLTASERRKILATEVEPECPLPLLFEAPTWLSVHRLRNAGIAVWLIDGKLMQLTKLGLAVRAHLQGETP